MYPTKTETPHAFELGCKQTFNSVGRGEGRVGGGGGGGKEKGTARGRLEDVLPVSDFEKVCHQYGGPRLSATWCEVEGGAGKKNKGWRKWEGQIKINNKGCGRQGAF